MIDHIGLDVSDIGRSRAFYETALAPLGYRVVSEDRAEGVEHPNVVMFGVGGEPDFVIAKDKAPGPATTSPSAPKRGPRSTPSTPPPSQRAGATTAGRASASTMGRPVTRPSCWIPTASTSRRFATRRNEAARARKNLTLT